MPYRQHGRGVRPNAWCGRRHSAARYPVAAAPASPLNSSHIPRVLALLLIFLLILANGVFALAEIATVSARRSRLQQRADEGDDGSRVALELISEPARFLSTVQIGITLIGILLGAVAGDTIADTLADYIRGVPALAEYAQGIGLGIVVISLTFLSVVVGELVPKQLALTHPERIASAMAPAMRVLSVVAAPIVRLLTSSTGLLIRMMGIDAAKEAPISAEEIKILLEQGERAGIFEPTEQDIVENALHLDELRTSAIVTPRTKMVWIDLDEPAAVQNEVIFNSPHAHFPVARGTLEDVSGVVRGRDILALQVRASAGEVVDITPLLRPPLFVPGSQSVLRLLEQLRHSGQHIALVLDEYGGLMGMATLTDVMEALVGEIHSAGVPHEPFSIKLPDGAWLLDGRIAIHELKDLLDLPELPGEEEGDYETLGGLVMDVLGKIPSEGDNFVVERWAFRVELMEGRRVSRVVAKTQVSVKAGEPGQA